MIDVIDDRGYNQGYKQTDTTTIRLNRRGDYVLSLMNLEKETADVLEIGCGRGELSYYVASNSHFKVTGSDLCKPFIEIATTNYTLPNCNFITLDFNDPSSLEGKMYDYIIGNGIIHHLYPDLLGTFTNLKKLLKPGGKIIFMEPNLLNPYCFLIFHTTKTMREWAKLEPNEMALRKSEIKRILQTCGFTQINIEYKDWLIPITPSNLVQFVCKTGALLERIPFLRCWSQSLFFSAENQ